mmetsp:Transcript_32979/g.49821  ORF Transcript_32979/g.49821 Transcript_32979/m.49821 type:complete len:667 (-) Transcript_32979:188-2188(-)
MISRWFIQSLGQTVAPDEKITAESEREEADSLWTVMAPDAAWEASQHGPKEPINETSHKTTTNKSIPPSEAFALTSTNARTEAESTPRQVLKAADPSYPSTPSNNQVPVDANNLGFMSPLEKGVLDAARGTADSIMSPKFKSENIMTVFRWCTFQKPLPKNLLKKLRNLLEERPELISARASLGSAAPDGFTPLMACAYKNQVEAAKIIIEMDEESKNHVDLQGNTALHIASHYGSLDVIRLLQSSNSVGPDAPLNLFGHTPLGSAVTSKEKSARRAQAQLSQALFSPGDKSIRGQQTPLKERSEVSAELNASIGYFQMPGMRVIMEDSISVEKWDGNALVSVCDGHSDNAFVSKFICEKAKEVYLHHAIKPLPIDQKWILTCLTLDELVKESKYTGGSTGLWAHITESSVVVVNVGDCRCVLIENDDGDDLVGQMETLNIAGEDAKEDTQPLEEDSNKGTKGGEETAEIADSSEEMNVKKMYTVRPLSIDHKPDLDGEQERIENAGMQVIEEIYHDSDGRKQTIPKIELAEGRRMAVSRAFGDFEYKSNSKLPGPEDQAVCAIPFIHSHARSEKDAFLVLACDGVWDVMTNEEVADFVMSAVEKALEDESPSTDILPEISDMLCEECLTRGSKDNLSVILVALSGTATRVADSGVLKRKALDFGP